MANPIITNSKIYHVGTLSDLTGLGSDDGLATDMIGYVADKDLWYQPTSVAASTSTWEQIAHSGGQIEGIQFEEQADHPQTPVATKGQLWVRNDGPNVLVYTDDVGTDTVLGAGGGGGGAGDVVQKTVTSSTGSIAAAGSATLDLTSFFDVGQVIKLTVAQTAGGSGNDIDVEVYTKDTFLTADRIYNAENADASGTGYIDRNPFFYEDEDTTDEFHIKIINNGASATTFDVTAIGQGKT